MNFKQSNTIYAYDGSFDGFLTCAFEIWTRREMPAAFANLKDAQPVLLETFFVETDAEKAQRVGKSILQKMGDASFNLLEETLWTCLENKEIAMINYMRLGYKEGFKTINLIDKDAVKILTDASRFLHNEAHYFKEFIRFGKYDDLLVAKIKPKNFVLPITSPHFTRRMPNEKFIIYDETHEWAFAYANGKSALSQVSGWTLPKAKGDEKEYQKLWKAFYNTIAVEGRTNHKCRMTHMPKRYWSNLTEFQ